MAPFHQILMIVLSGIIGFMIVVFIVVMIKPSSHSNNQSLPTEILERSRKYVDNLGNKSFEDLKTNQKLLLIHAYYENFKIVVQHAETMIDELRQLPMERKAAFADIIENAYRHLGQEDVIMEFREVVGL